MFFPKALPLPADPFVYAALLWSLSHPHSRRYSIFTLRVLTRLQFLASMPLYRGAFSPRYRVPVVGDAFFSDPSFGRPPSRVPLKLRHVFCSSTGPLHGLGFFFHVDGGAAVVIVARFCR